jgi:hypothetical protein
MKIIYYERERESFITPTFSFDEHCFYLPEKNVLLYRHNRSALDPLSYASTTDVKRLDEAKQVVENKLRRKGEMKFSGIKRFNYDSPGLQVILQGASDEPELRKGIEELIKKAGKE